MSITPVSLGTISDVIPTGINVPPIDYTSRDYASLVNDLLTLIPSYIPEWTDRSPGDFGIVLIEAFSYMGDILNFYSDRIANEAYIATAQQRQSVLNLASLLDYTPHGSVAAQAQLQFTLTSPSAPVLIPSGTQVATLNTIPVVFETSSDLWIFGDGISKVAPPGGPAISNGAAGQQIVLQTADPNPPYTPWYIYNGSVNQIVQVAPPGANPTWTTWTLAPGNSFTGVASTATVYTIVNGNIVQFGDGVHGAIPQNGYQIQVSYQPGPPNTYTGIVWALNGQSVNGEGLGIADGTPLQKYTLFNTPVVDGSVAVFVDQGQGPAQWTYKPRMVDALSSDQAFTLSTDANGVVTIGFGDNVNGQIPPPGALITADYMMGGGSTGNVAANTLTQLQSGPTISSVTNPSPATAGADIETTDHIRIHAPLSVTAINRAVTLNDFAALSLNIPSIAKAAASSTAYNAVDLYIHPAGDFFGYGNDPTATVAALNAAVNALAPMITNSAYTGFLDDKKMVTTSVVVLPPQYTNGTSTATGYVPCDVIAVVQVLPQYSNSAITASVTAALKNLFLFSVVDFGYRVSLSSVYHAVMNVEGVDYVTVTQLRRHEAAASTVGDIVCSAHEIPQAYQITVTANGGLP
jgi:hypothetical protein